MLTLDLLDQVDRLQEEMNRLFAHRGEAAMASLTAPALNAWAGDETLTVTAELPGIDINQLDIAVNGNVLTLRGQYPEPELKDGESWIRRERPSGAFVRTFELPFRVESDRVEATYRNGLLFVTLPRAESEKPKRIEVKAA